MLQRILALVFAVATATVARAQPSYEPRNDEPNPYLRGASWGRLPDGRKWGATAPRRPLRRFFISTLPARC
jgi:hypothetical protein